MRSRRPINSTTRLTLCALVAAACLGVAPVGAQELQTDGPPPVSREYRIKAAFLYQFLRYVEWPDASFGGPGNPYVIGSYRANPFGEAARKIAEEKSVNERSIEFRTIDSAAAAGDCHILFVPSDATPGDIRLLLEAARGRPLLVVSDADGFVELGGDVQFFLQDNKVRFAFHADFAARPLRVSSKLLSLSKPAPTTEELPY